MSRTIYPLFYRKSLPPGSIRLLRLLPHEDENAPIQCELFHYSLQESGTRTHLYDALSYVWGDPAETQSLFIREQNSTRKHNLLVTENLYKVLLRLRDHQLGRVVWIDALCINQRDDREKEQQIQLIAKIYSLANRVLVWLGGASDDSDRALREVRSAGGYKRVIPSNPESHVQAVTALLQRPWFRRIWVLQEVAAARHILIMCGATEIDGYAFCLGLEAFERLYETQGDFLRSTRSILYLIKGSIFRPESSMSSPGSASLNICSLSELMDMYNTHKATKRHDKVYALLGMSTDDASNLGLSPDYSVPWENLLQRLVKYILHEKISVETWGGNTELAVIKSKGYILSKVYLIHTDTGQDKGDGVTVKLKNKEVYFDWTVQTSAKPIREGDLVCHLQGAPKPTIIRPHHDYSEIIILAARPLEEGFSIGEGDFVARDLLLVWDWEDPSESLQRQKYYEYLLRERTSMLKYTTGHEDQLDRATRIWNIALILGDAEKDLNAEQKLREAIKRYGIAFGVEPRTLKSGYGLTPLSWAAGNGYGAVVRQLLGERKIEVDLDLKDSVYGQTPLSLAAENGHEKVIKLLLDTGKVDVDTKDQDRRTPLSWAAENGHEKVIKLLLDTGKVDVDTKDQDGRTPLSWAAENGHEKVIKLLLDTGKVEVDIKDQGGRTPLLWAAENGNEAVFKLLLDTGRVDVDTEDRYGRTPLLWAAENGNEAVVKLLLDTGKVDVDIKDQFRWTPLFWAVYNKCEAAAKLLLDTGEVEVDIKDRDGWTPLLWAAGNGNEAVVKLLLDTGKVDVNAKDQTGRTPLLWAAWNGHEIVAKLLLDTGKVDVDTKVQDGRTPLSWAAENGHEAVVKLLLNTDKVNVDARDQNGWTPLLWAAGKGHEAVVKLLLDLGKVDVNAKGYLGITPLSLAAYNEHEAVVKLLLDTGRVDVNTKDKTRMTLLSWAAGKGHETVVKLLLNTVEVDVNAKDKTGRTPLSWAGEKGHETVVKLLLDTGKVDVNAKDYIGRTPLSWAGEKGHETAVKLLLDTGKVDVNAKDKTGRTPLSWAGEKGHEQVAQLLSNTGKIKSNVEGLYSK